MAKSFVGATVLYCGHKGVFVADIWEVAGANVVRASKSVTPGNILRDEANINAATHHMSDFPQAGFWRPEIGVFVIPKGQVKELIDGRKRP